MQSKIVNISIFFITPFLSGIGTTTIMYTVIIVPTQVSSLEFLSTFFRNVLSLNWHYPTTAIQDSTRYNTAYLVELIVYPVGHVIISSVCSRLYSIFIPHH